MSRALSAVKGMNDILPEEIGRWHAFEGRFRAAVELFGYSEIRVPIIEATPLYVRSVGEGTDIVDKEMYSFVFHDEPLTVRPEGTAGVVRAYVEHGLAAKEPTSRVYYLGPMFRGERPARGRYRQFYQAGCEVFGDAGPGVDAEMIDMLVRFFASLSIDGLEVLVNSLGGKGTKAAYRERLVTYLRPMQAELSEDSRRRLETNPLRILDSKHERDQAAIAGAPSVLDCIDDEDKRHFDRLLELMTKLGTPFRVEPRLVRGLDYYARTLFEIKGRGGDLGAQNTLCGGGRYDGLVEELGGTPGIPSIGFALGIERILLASTFGADQAAASVFVAPLGERAGSEALVLGRELREAGIKTLVETRGGSLKAMLRRANAVGARLALVLGDGELDRGVVQLKDLAAHAQADVTRDALVAAVREKLA
ncbi:MAG: histidine--tRNA ligase [Myxococcales bacterium]|nr:histidine--tRNA ligase [Myxococcales bacterium]